MQLMSRILADLTDAPGLEPASKMVYVIAMMKQPASVQSLAYAAGMDARSVMLHCRQLQSMGWMQLLKDGKQLRPEAVLPYHLEAGIAAEIRSLVCLMPFKGEATTVTFIEWIVAPTVRLLIHARPDFLRNKETNQNLEYDIYAPAYAWATEYHGDQHFGPTTRYPSKDAFIERHKRDLLKLHLSDANGIRLSVVHNQLLTLDGILGVIPIDVPLRAIDPKGPMILMLEELGREVAGNQDWDRE